MAKSAKKAAARKLTKSNIFKKGHKKSGGEESGSQEGDDKEGDDKESRQKSESVWLGRRPCTGRAFARHRNEVSNGGRCQASGRSASISCETRSTIQRATNSLIDALEL